jgi:transcriptional regulator with XRE-family HTH domain
VADVRIPFGRRVRELRHGLGLTQEQLAERAELHWTYVSGIERGLRSPRLHVVAKLAKALNVDLADLFSTGSRRP